MENEELIYEFMRITAALKSGPEKSSNKMQDAFSILANILAWNPPANSIYMSSDESSIDRWADETALFNLDAQSRNELKYIITNAIQSAVGPVPLQDARRIYRRTVPFHTAIEPSSQPKWGEGQSLEKTLGPFTDCYGRIMWFDIYRSANHISLVRQPLVGNKITPILLLPYQDSQLKSMSKYAIPGGSIWILSSLLAPNAPKDAYCGLKVAGGTMRLSSPPSVAGGQLTVGPKVTVTLELAIDATVRKMPFSGPGGDARESVCTLPEKVIFEFRYSGGRLKEGSDAEISAYDNSFRLSFSQRAPRFESEGVFEPLLNCVLLPMGFAAGDNIFPGPLLAKRIFEVNRCQSDLFMPSGSAKVLGGGWALPVAIAAPQDLGNAKGSGGIALSLDRGIRATWLGLAGGSASLGKTMILVRPGMIEMASSSAANPGAAQGWTLWSDGFGGSGQSRIDLGFASPFPLRFICKTSLESLIVRGSIDASVDRPIRADRSRIPLRASNGTIVFWQEGNSLKLKVASALKPDFTPFPMALSNALMAARPPYGLKMQASLSAQGQIQDGSLLLPIDILRLTPMLRDPYVSSLPGAETASGGETIPSASYKPIFRLLSCTKWKNSNDIILMLQLMPYKGAEADVKNLYLFDANSAFRVTATEKVRTINPDGLMEKSELFINMASELPDYETTKLEDQRAEIDLRTIFQEGAGRFREQLFLLDVSGNVDQSGVGLGFSFGSIETGNLKSDMSAFSLPFSIADMDLVVPGRNLKVFMLPQIQWEPVINVPSKNVGYFPEKTGSPDDGGPALIGANSVTLVPIAPDCLVEQIINEFNQKKIDAAALFTLPFGMKAAALFQNKESNANSWASLNLIKFEALEGSFKGGLQISAASNSGNNGPEFESPSFPGAAYQTRNLVDMHTSNLLGRSVLSGDIPDEDPEAYFNNEMGPSSPIKRVPVTRIDFSGYGASMFSHWINPNVISGVSQACFDVMVGRTAHEVVQICSILYPWAVSVVRTITLERRMEGHVIRKDSGWIATGSGLFRYPPPDSKNVPNLPTGWTEIETHPGLVSGVYNVRNIQQTEKVIDKSVDPRLGDAELLEVRFDGDFDIQGVVAGMNGNRLVTGCRHIGYVQASPIGYPLLPEQLMALMDLTGPIGGPVDCIVEIDRDPMGEGLEPRQKMHVVRVDVDAAPSPTGPPHFAAAVHGSLDLPKYGKWSVLRAQGGAFQPVRSDIGVPVIRSGTTSKKVPLADYFRIAEQRDLQQEDNPSVEFGILQSSEAHRIIFPRPRISKNRVLSTEKPLLADIYSLSGSAGLFPDRSVCLVGETAYELEIAGDPGYVLGQTKSMDFIPPIMRPLFASNALGVKLEYLDNARYELDSGSADNPWSFSVPLMKLAMDLGPFTDLMIVSHSLKLGEGVPAKFTNPSMEYPSIQDIVSIIQFLTKLLGMDNIIDVILSPGSFKFQAALDLPVEDPNASNGYFDLPPVKIKGRLKMGVGNQPAWNGYLGISLGMEVPIILPIYGMGEAAIMFKGSELTAQEIAIQLTWGADIPIDLKVIEVQGSVYYKLGVSVADDKTWQIGLLVGVSGTVDLWIATITARLELSAAVVRQNNAVHAIGQARFAAEIEICWFLTIDIDYTVEYETDDLGI